MSGLDSDILREKIKQKMPKPPKFSFGCKGIPRDCIYSPVTAWASGRKLYSGNSSRSCRSDGPIRSGFRHCVEPGIQL